MTHKIMSGLQKIFLKRMNKIVVFIFSLVLLMAYSSESISTKGNKEVTALSTNIISNRVSLKDRLTSIRNNNKIMVCAHRGNHLNAPENSLKSITDAINSGIGMVELDVRKTSDGVLVLMHDATIDRTTNGSGTVSNLSLNELQQFKLKKKDGTITDEKIPTLAEVLELARGKIYIDLDIDRRSDFSDVYPLVNLSEMLNQVMFYSSELSEIQEMVNHINSGNILAMPIIRNQDNFDEYRSLDLDVVQFNRNDNSIKQQIQGKSWFIFRNAYVNSSDTPKSDNYAKLNEAIVVGASIVQTDNPLEVKCKLFRVDN